MDIQGKIKLTRGMEVPVYATPGSAAVDLRAALDDGAEITLAPGARALIPTGLAVSPESTGYVAIIAGRSGLGVKNGVSLSNGIGVIDSDYRGEIQVGLINHGSEPFTVHRGDRIAQMFFLPVAHADLLVTDTLDETERSTGGFGHTGIR